MSSCWNRIPQASAEERTRVLLVDDKDLLVMHVKRILERSGFAFHFASGRAKDSTWRWRSSRT
jgi:PleD family two-component response regulator